MPSSRTNCFKPGSCTISKSSAKLPVPLTQEFKGAHPDIPWKQIIGMRNVLVHAYFGIDEIAVWEVVERDIPNLEPAVSTVLRSLDKPPE